MLSTLALTILLSTSPRESPFAQRGYYITFSRMPTYDLADWRVILDGIRDDGGNTVLLWVAGAVRLPEYPITWRYNADHENIRRDFLNALIDHAHSRGIRVLLGFTPFGYDGVNQYSIKHPELRAVGPDGTPVAAFGIGCWGYNLCPSKPESQAFMLGYARGLLSRYPNADGLLIESSDYAICHCEGCSGHFFEREFEFVRKISDEAWARNPEATLVVFPHYFTGAEVPGLGVRAAKLPFDPRWSLVFTPHSAHLDANLVKQARSSLWWDDSPVRRGPEEVRAGARRARDAGVTGYLPSLESFTFVSTNADEAQPWLVGRRQIPLGFGWLEPGEPPYNVLPMRVNRIAYREFARDPDLPFGRYREILGREVLGASSDAQAIDDLLTMQRIFNAGRTWCQPSPATSPARVRAMASSGALTPELRRSVRVALQELGEIWRRHRVAESGGPAELARVARWLLDQWGPEEQSLLDDGRTPAP